MKNKYSELPVGEELRKYKKENKTLLISAVICTIAVVAISIVFFVCKLDKVVAMGFLALLPFSWWIGYYIPKKENEKEINKLEKHSKN